MTNIKYGTYVVFILPEEGTEGSLERENESLNGTLGKLSLGIAGHLTAGE
jgi:hypothetical protein